VYLQDQAKSARFSSILGRWLTVLKIKRYVRVTFIPKVGKRDLTFSKSFRPICLSSFLLKTLDKMIDNYNRTEIVERVPLHLHTLTERGDQQKPDRNQHPKITRAQRNGYMRLLKHRGSIRQHLSRSNQKSPDKQGNRQNHI